MLVSAGWPRSPYALWLRYFSLTSVIGLFGRQVRPTPSGRIVSVSVARTTRKGRYAA